MFRRFPPSKSRKVILAQSYRTMQDQAYRKVLHLVLFAQRSGPDQPSRSSGRGLWLMLGKASGVRVYNGFPVPWVFGPTPGAEISSFKARVSASRAARASPALVIRACSDEAGVGAMASRIRSTERFASVSNWRLTTSPRRLRRESVFSRNSSRALRRRFGRMNRPYPATIACKHYIRLTVSR
jgi:hypothetical protein